MSKILTISIDPVGKTTVDAEGFLGNGCKEASQPIIDALSDGTQNDVEDKPELYQMDTEAQTETY